MSIAIADIRFAIQDNPRSKGSTPESPRVLGTGDGVTAIFSLPLGQFQQYVAGSATLFATATGSTQTGIDPTTWSITQQGLVTFAVAPAAGTIISAAFQVTTFADADLSNVLARNLAQYGGSTNSDANVLRGCQIEILNVLLGSPDLLATIREAEWERDPAAVVAAMQKQLAELRTQIGNAPRPDASIPILTIAGPILFPYQPRR
jgi:hypothetical protein